jgi:hypothetical protein
MHDRRRWLIAAVAVAALGAAGGTALAVGHHHRSWSRTPARAIKAVSAAQLNAFAVLRQAPVAAVPASIQGFASDPTIAAAYAPNAALARAVYPNGASSQPWYIVPGDNSLCFDTGVVGGCQTLAAAEAGKLMVWGVRMPPRGGSRSSQEGASVVMGVVPDEVTSASASTANGDVSVHLANNTLQVAGTSITGITFTRASGGPLAIGFLH